jgi:hypothetical protein
MYKSKFCKTLSVIVGLSIITWILYRSFILKRISYEINENVSWYIFTIVRCIWSIHIIRCMQMMGGEGAPVRPFFNV